MSIYYSLVALQLQQPTLASAAGNPFWNGYTDHGGFENL